MTTEPGLREAQHGRAANSTLREGTAAPGDAEERHPFADGVTVGLGTMIAGAFGVMAVYGEIFLDALAFVVVLAGLAIWAARSASSRLRWIIAGLATLFVGINLVYAIPDLSHPESPGAFFTSAVVVVSGLVTASCAVLAARHRPASGRRVWLATYGVLAIAGVGSLLASASVTDAIAQAGDTTIVAEAIAFPEDVVMAAESNAIVVPNLDRVRHTFVIEGEVAAVEVPAGSQVRIPVDLGPGTYRFFCDIVGHEAMGGTLIVE